MEDKIFRFRHFLRKPMLYRIYCHFITWICSILSNVFVPSCPMYWWSVSSDSMLLNPTKKKMHDFLARKVFACVLMVQSFSLSSGFLCVFIFFPISSAISVMKLSLYRPVSFWICLILLHSVDCSYETQQEKRTCLFCVVTVMVMQVITVLFKRTSGPVKAFEGKITYIALTS